MTGASSLISHGNSRRPDCAIMREDQRWALARKTRLAEKRNPARLAGKRSVAAAPNPSEGQPRHAAAPLRCSRPPFGTANASRANCAAHRTRTNTPRGREGGTGAADIRQGADPGGDHRNARKARVNRDGFASRFVCRNITHMRECGP
jgi:hypothetical protein